MFIPQIIFNDLIFEVKDCGEVENPEHGDANDDVTTVGQSVEFTCDIGYELVGPKEAECKPNGKWDPEDIPVCESKFFNNL